MKDYSKTIADAQAFIDSVKEFNNDGDNRYYPTGLSAPPEVLNSDRDNIPVRGSRSNPFGSADNPFQDSLKESGHGLPVSKPFSVSFSPNGSSRNFLDRPLELKFSRSKEYENPFRVDVLTFIEVYYYETKKLPDFHVLHEHFRDHPERPNFLRGWATVLDSIADSLQNRGIKPYNTTDNYIDPKFAWAVSLVVNHLDKRTIPAKLKEAGLTTKEWQAFMRRKRHFDYFQSRLDEVFTQDVKNDAKIALARSIQNGDLQAIKYYNELQNIYRPETQSAIQMVSIVLTAVMEILAQHVSSDIINRVAAEIRSSPSVRKIIEIEK